jgi:hypothetical protein
MRFTISLLSAFVALSASSVACAPKLGTETEGDKGSLVFQYTGRDCVLGCAVDRAALQGSRVDLTVQGGVAAGAKARIVDTTIATVAEQSVSCPDGDLCSIKLSVETHLAGDAKLEVIDVTGKVIDSVTLPVRPAARIDVTPSGGTDVSGTYEVQRYSRLALASRVYDAAGVEVVFAKHGLGFDYADKSIVAPDPTAIVGSTDVEDMIALRTGETTVKVHAPGADRVLRFRVVP